MMLRKRFVIETVLDTLKSEWGFSIHAIGRSSTPFIRRTFPDRETGLTQDRADARPG